MTTEKLEKANNIIMLIDDIDNMLYWLRERTLIRDSFNVNIEDEQEKLDAVISNYLQKRKAQLQKEFDKL